MSARGLTCLAVAYAAVVTSDLRWHGVPLKIVVLSLTVLAWIWRWRLRPPLRGYALALPILLTGLAVPTMWLGVAAARHGAGDPAQAHGLRYAGTEASHFLYLLIFFPLVDLLRERDSAGGADPWLRPVLLTAALTVGLFLAWTLFGFDYGRHSLSPLQGTVGVESSGDYRVEFVTQVLFIPAVVLVLAQIEAYGPSLRRVLMVALLLGATYASHTRGYWLGLVVSTGVLIVLTVGWPRGRGLRAAAVPAVLLALTGTQVALLAGVGSAHRASQVSIAQRLDQAAALRRGIDRQPVLGSGLGATLPSGYRRSRSDPWSFELTYLQLLFELGAIGLLAVLWLPLTILWQCWRKLPGLESSAMLSSRVAIAALTGLLCADASNPDLINSAGMLALAVVAAHGELALGGHPARTARQRTANRGPAATQNRTSAATENKIRPA